MRNPFLRVLPVLKVLTIVTVSLLGLSAFARGGDSAGGASQVVGLFRSLARDLLQDPRFVNLPHRQKLLDTLNDPKLEIKVVWTLTDERGKPDMQRDHFAYGYYDLDAKRGVIQLLQAFWTSVDKGTPVLHDMIHELYRAANILEEGRNIDDNYRITVHQFHLDSPSLVVELARGSIVGYYAKYVYNGEADEAEAARFSGHNVRIVETVGEYVIVHDFSNPRREVSLFDDGAEFKVRRKNLSGLASPEKRFGLQVNYLTERVKRTTLCGYWASGLLPYTSKLPYVEKPGEPAWITAAMKISGKATVSAEMINARLARCLMVALELKFNSHKEIYYFFSNLHYSNPAHSPQRKLERVLEQSIPEDLADPEP